MIRFTVSPGSKLDDIRALLDTYAVEVVNGPRVYLRAPIPLSSFETLVLDAGNLEGGTLYFQSLLSVRLCRYEPPEDPVGGIWRRTRWPFYVHNPLEIMFCIDIHWWTFTFTPGNTYEERTV